MTDTLILGTPNFVTDLRMSLRPRRILSHLLKSGSISNAEAITVFSEYRLSDVIHKLRGRGYNIETVERKDAMGRNYCRYLMEV